MNTNNTNNIVIYNNNAYVYSSKDFIEYHNILVVYTSKEYYIEIKEY